MRITSKGQVTIPQSVREAAGLMPGTDVDFVIDKGAVKLVKAKKGGKGKKKLTKGELAVARLRGSADIKMTTDEIMALMRGPSVEDELGGE